MFKKYRGFVATPFFNFGLYELVTSILALRSTCGAAVPWPTEDRKTYRYARFRRALGRTENRHDDNFNCKDTDIPHRAMYEAEAFFEISYVGGILYIVCTIFATFFIFCIRITIWVLCCQYFRTTVGRCTSVILMWTAIVCVRGLFILASLLTHVTVCSCAFLLFSLALFDKRAIVGCY